MSASENPYESPKAEPEPKPVTQPKTVLVVMDGRPVIVPVTPAIEFHLLSGFGKTFVGLLAIAILPILTFTVVFAIRRIMVREPIVVWLTLGLASSIALIFAIAMAISAFTRLRRTLVRFLDGFVWLFAWCFYFGFAALVLAVIAGVIWSLIENR